MINSSQIGFTPNGSQYSLALHWAQYLSLYAYNHDIGPNTQTKQGTAKITFPGNVASSKSLSTPVSSKTVARFMIYASVHAEKCGDGQLFNIADNEKPCTFGEIWPQLAEWFGLTGVGPGENSSAQDKRDTFEVGELPQNTPHLTPGEYIAQNKGIFTQNGREKAVRGGVGAGNRQLDSVGYWLTFDRQMSLKRLRETGFEEERDPVQGWLESFAMFRRAGLIL